MVTHFMRRGKRIHNIAALRVDFMMWKGGDGRAGLMTGFIKLMSCSYWLCPDTNTAAGKHTPTPTPTHNKRHQSTETMGIRKCYVSCSVSAVVLCRLLHFEGVSHD